MAAENVQRKLVAVLAADVAGYSQLMSQDELGTHTRLKAILSEVFRPTVKRHGGRIFKTMGDGALAEFASINEAVQGAVEVQRTLAERETHQGAEEPIRLRIGISLGDVIVDGSDLFGNGVNIAARMESLAEPGAICISGNVREHLKGNREFNLVSLGPCEVKNIPDPVEVFQIQENRKSKKSPPSFSPFDQEIRFCMTPDGVRVAYATIGQGPAVVIVSNWLTHLELDFQMPMRRGLVEMLAPDHQVVRYDARGSGLSDREVDDFSLEASIMDLETVIEDLGLEGGFPRRSITGCSNCRRIRRPQSGQCQASDLEWRICQRAQDERLGRRDRRERCVHNHDP